MKNVLVTGSSGFVGKNLLVALQHRDDARILPFDLNSDPATLGGLCRKADFIFHLAGVNRPQNPEEFRSGNTALTQDIIDLLEDSEKHIPIVLCSSTQAALDNPYGISKRQAEDAVFNYAARSGASAYVYRLPNLFGKWCRPNYNSVVATFCHNIAHGQPITVHDPSVTLTLAYIDDVVDAFIAALEGRAIQRDEFAVVEAVHTARLGWIADTLQYFKKSRGELSLPELSDPLTKKLYSTYLSYLPTSAFSYPLKMNVDERGSFTEFLRTPDRGQVSVNISRPGITKGNHWHHTKNEKFLVVSGSGLIQFRQVGGDEIIEYPVSGEKLEVVDIPPGYTHNIINVGDQDMVTVMWVNEPFDPDRPDTFFEKVEL